MNQVCISDKDLSALVVSFKSSQTISLRASTDAKCFSTHSLGSANVSSQALEELRMYA